MAVDGDLFLEETGFAVVGFEGVIAGRESFDGEVAVGIGDGEEGMVDDVDVGEFPGMNIAFEAEETFGLSVIEGEGRSFGKHGEIGFGIALL